MNAKEALIKKILQSDDDGYNDLVMVVPKHLSYDNKGDEVCSLDELKALVAPLHRCNGVNGGKRHGTANACSVCGEYRSGYFTYEGVQLYPADKVQVSPKAIIEAIWGK